METVTGVPVTDKMIQEWADEEHLSRSSVIRAALRSYVA